MTNTPHAAASDQAMTSRIAHVTVQFSDPRDDARLAAELRADGLVPLLVNGTHVAATTEDHLQQALDSIVERLEGESPAQTRAFRRTVWEAVAGALEAGEDADFTNFPDDAVLLLAEGLVHHGFRRAEQLPFCAVRFLRDDLETPMIAERPRA